MIGKNYLITGGTSGLGERIFYELIDRGAYVIICGRSKQKLEEMQASHPEKILAFQLDMSDRTNIEALSEWLKSEHIMLDGVINNAGYGYFKSLAEHTSDEIIDMSHVNFTHTVLLTKMTIPFIREGGHIVNIASQAARVTTPYGSIYAATKAALYSFSNALRMEHPELNVMTVNPGPVNTSFFERADHTGTYRELTKHIQIDSALLAEEIVDSMMRHKLEVNRPKWMHYGLTLYQLMPRWIEKNFEQPFLSKMKK